jgi:hypothetical protein
MPCRRGGGAAPAEPCGPGQACGGLMYPRTVYTDLNSLICKTIIHIPFPLHQDTLAPRGEHVHPEVVTSSWP